MLKYLKKYWIFCILAPLFMFGEVSMDLIQPRLMKIIVDDGVLGLNGGGSIELIISTGIKMIGFVVIGGICGILSGVFANICSQSFSNDLRKDAFKRVMEYSFEQTDRFSPGSVITRITNDITQVQNLVAQVIRGFVRTGLLIAGGIVCMIGLNLSFGAVIAISLPFILGCVIFFMAKASPLFGILQSKLDKLNGVMQENITGARVVKAYVKEDYEKGRFGSANDELIDSQLKILTIFAYMTPVMNILLNCAVLAVIYIGGIEVKAGELTPGAVMAAVTYISQVLNAVMRMSMIFQNVSRGVVSAKRINELLETEPKIKDGFFNGKAESVNSIEFKNVSFKYAGGSYVLKNINLAIKKGESVGILGATGSGKTTLVSLIPRFYDVSRGEVLVDGVNVKDYTLKALRDKIAVGLQKSELFNRSIKENILWGKPGASLEELDKASETAQAKSFIEENPEGYNRAVAEKGMSLSGGQRQRIAISRAIIKNAEILILDDCTSALDLKTEDSFYKALNKNYGSMTKVIVAQRIASVMGADKIAVIENGEIAALGSHKELIENSEIYRDIYNSQLKRD